MQNNKAENLGKLIAPTAVWNAIYTKMSEMNGLPNDSFILRPNRYAKDMKMFALQCCNTYFFFCNY